MCVSSATTLVVESTLAFAPTKSCWEVCIWAEAEELSRKMWVTHWPTHQKNQQFPKESVLWARVSAARGGLIWWNLWNPMIVSTRILEFVWICKDQNFDSIQRKPTGFPQAKLSKLRSTYGRLARLLPILPSVEQEILGASASQRLRARQSRCEVPDGYDKDWNHWAISIF